MATRWETARSVWIEDDGGSFILQDSAGPGATASPADWQALPRSRHADIAALLGASLPRRCAHSSIYPEGFAFCPVCGESLTTPARDTGAHGWRGVEAMTTSAQNAGAPEWWGVDASLPRHVPQGLPVTALPLAAAIEARAPVAPARPDLTLPAAPNAVCVFAAARFGYAAQRLLALAYTRNALQYWDPCARLWHVLAAEEGASALTFTVSDYAWLPAEQSARRGEVAIVPTASGLFRLLIDPLRDSYRTEPVLQAPLVSAPGAARRRIACLFKGSAGVALWTAQADGADPEVLACPAIPDSDWSRPLFYDDRLIWLHAEGHLLWQPGGAPAWVPWPAGWRPKRDFGGPVQSRDGRLWLIGHDGQAYSFVELGTASAQVEPIAGARLGFATLLFRRGHPVINEPWDTETIEDPAENESLVLPLLQQFNGLRHQPAGLVLRVERYTGRVESALESMVLPQVTVEWIGQRNVRLDELVRLARPADCLPFIYDGCLWLHHPDWSQIRGWRLKDAA
jgi:hypothetical protein